MKIFIVAGEESGDRLGGALMQALARRLGPTLRFEGVGGSAMAAQGLDSVVSINELPVVGIAAVALYFKTILPRIRATAAAAIAARPDVLVIIDSPEFSHRVARRVRAAAHDIPIVDYVSPSIWAWRPGRARAMKGYIDHVLALLPFEPAAHTRLGGPPCTYVGHPLTEQVSRLRPDAEAARRRDADPPLVLVLPGSRAGELAHHLDVFGAAMTRLADRCGALEPVIPAVPHFAERLKMQTATWAVRPRIIVEEAEKWAAFRTARVALAASGTVTLELAVAGVPTVVAYRAALVTEFLYRAFVRVPTIVLANLVLDDKVMPEFLQRQATPERLAAALALLIRATPERQKQLDAFARLDAILGIGTARPSEAAADIVIEVARRGRRGQSAVGGHIGA